MGTAAPALLAAAAAFLLPAAAAVGRDPAIADRLDSAAPARPGRTLARIRAAARRLGSNRRLRSLADARLIGVRLQRAGWALPPEELVGWKAVCAAGAGVALLLAPWPGPLVAPLVVPAAFRVPDILVGSAARRRMAQADRELPQLLDLLAAGSSAGLAAPLALRRAVSAMRGPLADELEGVIRAVDLGARWRDELAKASDRLALPDLRRAVTTLTRTERLGSSLADAMTALAGRVREARRAAAAERARKAPVKMLFPLVFLVLPAFLLLTVVPVLVATLRSIG